MNCNLYYGSRLGIRHMTSKSRHDRYIRTYILHIGIYTHVYMYMYIHICMYCMNVCLYTYLCMYVYSCMYVYMYTHVGMYAHTKLWELRVSIISSNRLKQYLYLHIFTLKNHTEHSPRFTPLNFIFLRPLSQSKSSSVRVELPVFPFFPFITVYSITDLMFSVTQRKITLSLCKSSSTCPHR